ncbi:MAG: DUF992 domain-containing protein [Pseudomonadota bacterium]
MKKFLITTSAALVMMASLGAERAAAQNAVEIGVLNCVVAGGIGFIFGSSKEMNCRFEQAGRVERYTGSISKFGLDIGVTGKAYMAWAVFAPRTNLDPGALQGTYGGATAEATAGLGVGANALVGGGNSITLQPVSVQGQSGLNVAAGIASMKLRFSY